MLLYFRQSGKCSYLYPFQFQSQTPLAHSTSPPDVIQGKTGRKRTMNNGTEVLDARD